MITETQLIKLARKLVTGIWYTSKELDAIWNTAPAQRKNILVQLKKRCMISTTGRTASIKYKVRPESAWNVLEKLQEVSSPEPIENNEATALDALIDAATKVGTDNEILRSKLIRIRAILEEV